MDYFNSLFKVESVDAKGYFKGYGSTFGNIDEGRDVVEVGAYDETIAKHTKDNTMPGMYWQHQKANPIGDWEKMSVDNKGLLMEGQLWLTQAGNTQADIAYRMLQGRGPKGLSIGYNIMDGGSQLDTKARVNRLSKLQLNEVSPVSFPMNKKCNIVSVKSGSPFSFKNSDGSLKTIREVEALLRDDAGLSATEAKAILAGGYSKMVPRDAGNWEDVLASLKKYS